MARRKTKVTVDILITDKGWSPCCDAETGDIHVFDTSAKAMSWIKCQIDAPGRYRIIRELAEVELKVTTVEKVEVV